VHRPFSATGKGEDVHLQAKCMPFRIRSSDLETEVEDGYINTKAKSLSMAFPDGLVIAIAKGNKHKHQHGKERAHEPESNQKHCDECRKKNHGKQMPDITSTGYSIEEGRVFPEQHLPPISLG
jgi:hypothetical protein